MTSLLLINPAASRMRDRARRDRVIAAVRAAPHLGGEATELVESTDPADLVAAARAAVAGGASRVVVCGGDGTVVAVAAALAGSGVPIAILPGGTGNVLAGALGIRAAVERVPALLRDARTRSLDVGRAGYSTRPASGAAGATLREARLFGVAVGIGFDARVMAATTSEQKRRLGKLSYFAAAVPAGLALRNVGCRLTVDGRTVDTEAAAVLVANTGELVPGVIGPRVPLLPDDGLLDVLLVRAGNPIEGLAGVLAALAEPVTDGAPRGQAWRTRAREVRVEMAEAEPVQVDGDAVGEGPLTAELLPEPAQVLVPAGR